MFENQVSHAIALHELIEVFDGFQHLHVLLSDVSLHFEQCVLDGRVFVQFAAQLD